MKNAFSGKSKWLGFATCSTLAACALTVTPAVWQSKVAIDTGTATVQGSGYDSAGNLYQLYYVSANDYEGHIKFVIRKVSNTGVELWSRELDNNVVQNLTRDYASVAACDSGVVLSDSYGRKLEKLNGDGNSQWVYDFSAEVPIGAISQIAVDNGCNFAVSHLFVNDASGATLSVDRFTPQGAHAWSQSVDLEAAVGVRTPLTLDLLAGNGLFWVYGIGQQPLQYRKIDGAGNTLAQGSIGDFDATVISADRQHVYLRSNTLVESYDLAGNKLWSHSTDTAIYSCANPLDGAFYCYGTNASTDGSQHFVKFHVNGDAPVSYPANIAGQLVSLSSLSDGNLLVLEHPYVNESLAKLSPQTFYSRFDVLDGQGKQTKSIVLDSGKVRSTYIWNYGYVLTGATAGDSVQAFMPYNNQLLVAGPFSVPGTNVGLPEAEAYKLK